MAAAMSGAMLSKFNCLAGGVAHPAVIKTHRSHPGLRESARKLDELPVTADTVLRPADKHEDPD